MVLRALLVAACIAIVGALPGTAFADTIVKTDSITADDPNQENRVSRGNPESTCASPTGVTAFDCAAATASTT